METVASDSENPDDRDGPSVKKARVEEAAADDHRSSTTTVWGDQYELVRRVLEWLPLSQVRKFAAVSRVWATASRLEQKARTSPTSPDMGVFSLTWVRKRLPDSLPVQTDLTFETEVHRELNRAIGSFVDGARFKTDTCLILATACRELEPEFGLDLNLPCPPNFLPDFGEIKRSFLQPGATLVSFCSTGLVVPLGAAAAAEKTGRRLVVELERPAGPALTLLAFPVGDLPGVDIVPVVIGKEQDPDLSVFAQVENRPKALLLLSNYFESDAALQAVRKAWRASGQVLAVGGGVGKFACLQGPDDNRRDHRRTASGQATSMSDLLHRTVGNDLVGLMFCGEGVEAASLVVGQNVRSKKALLQVLSRLKDTEAGRAAAKNGCSPQRSVAFMFACVGRGRAFYRGKANVEADAFRSLFPDTDLYGIFGDGELGYDSLPGCPGFKPGFGGDGAPNADDLFHAYTTIFLLISFPSTKRVTSSSS